MGKQKPSPRYRWEPEEDRILIEGRTVRPRLVYRAIARRLGRSLSAVWHRAAVLGLLKKRPIRKGGRKEWIRRVAKPGMSNHDIAKVCHTHFNYVRRVLKELGIPNGCDYSERSRKGNAVRRSTRQRPRCWGCNKIAGARSLQWCGRNGWYYSSWADEYGGNIENECYCPECWKLVKVYGMAGGSQPAGHSPPAGEPVLTPTGESSPNRLACASGTG